MSEALLTQYHLAQVLGAARLMRLVRAGWLAPAQRSPSRVLFRVSDVHAALQRLERGEALPPDRVESERVAKSKERNGHAYVPKGRKVRPVVWDLNLDFSAITSDRL
jgi:hypothetical protein